MTTGARWLIGLVLLLLFAAAGYWVGDHQRNNAWLAKQAKAERDAHAKYEAEVKRGNEAAGNYLADLADHGDRYAALERKFHEFRQRTPLVVDSPDVRDRVPGVAGGSGGCVRELGAQQSGRQPALGSVDVASPVLSLGAVWMWNSALLGTDVPAGACGADAATSGACAARAGVTLDDAWNNHTANAKSCAKDRLSYKRLIEFLKARPQ